MNRRFCNMTPAFAARVHPAPGESRAKLAHPNILSIFDFSREGDAAYAVMERLVGRCLEKEPAARIQSTSDLAFALKNSLDASGSGLHPAVSEP